MTLCFMGRHWWKDVEVEAGTSIGIGRSAGRICNHCSKKEIYWEAYRSWNYEWLSVAQVEKDLEKRKSRGSW